MAKPPVRPGVFTMMWNNFRNSLFEPEPVRKVRKGMEGEGEEAAAG